jgi:hypothetical protein
MPIYEIQRNGKTYEVEAPDPQLAAAAVDPTKATAFVDKRNVEAGVKPFQPGPLEKVGRYMADWGQGMRDAFSAPGEEGTVVGNVTSPAAGIVDAGLSVAGSIPASLIGMNELSRARMAGDTTTEYADLVEQNNPYGAPRTQTGQAYLNAVGSVIKPVGDLFNLAGGGAASVAGALGAGERAQEDIRAVVPDALGTVLDVAGAAGAGKATSAGRSALRTVAAESPVVTDFARARAGARAIDPATANLVPGENRTLPIDATPTSGEVYNPRPFGAAVEEARRVDYPLMPSQVATKAQTLADVGQLGRRVPGTARERFTSPAFETQFALDSQKVTNQLAAKEIGMDGVTRVSLDNAKAPHNAVYNEVVEALPLLRPDSELGLAADAIGEARRTNPLLKTTGAVEEVRDRLLMMENIPTQKALDAIRTYRKDAAKYYRQADLGQGDTVAAEQAGDAYKAAADALEQAIDRQSSTLSPGLIERMQYARQQLAKIHNVEDAFDGFNVDPQAIATMAKRFPLSGYLLDIARTAQQFPDTNYLTTGAKYPKSSLVGALDSVSLALRKGTGQETQNPSLLDRSFQNRYGTADPTYDPRPAPAPRAAPPIGDYVPPDPNLPGGAAVGPPTQGGGGGLAATGLADDFEILQPADMRVGDLTAETPPMGGSEVPFTDLGQGRCAYSGDLGLEMCRRGASRRPRTAFWTRASGLRPETRRWRAPRSSGAAQSPAPCKTRTAQRRLLLDEELTRPPAGPGDRQPASPRKGSTGRSPVRPPGWATTSAPTSAPRRATRCSRTWKRAAARATSSLASARGRSPGSTRTRMPWTPRSSARAARMPAQRGRSRPRTIWRANWSSRRLRGARSPTTPASMN